MIEALARLLPTRERRHLDHARRAAILVPVIADGGPLRVLLTRRTESLRSHTGQVAFPGGGVDEDDADVTAAALREAHEEVGLPPESVDTIGWLDDFITVGARMAVTPMVGVIRALPELRANPAEVARIFEIELSELRRPERWRIEHWGEAGETWPIYFFDHDGETLWGLSAIITLHLLALSPMGAPIELPEFTEALRRRLLLEEEGNRRMKRKR